MENEVVRTASAEAREEANIISRSREVRSIRAASITVDNVSWGKGLTPAQKQALEFTAREVGLSAALGHVVLLGNKPYVTIEGRLKVAHDSGAFLGFSRDEPLPKERWEEWGVKPDATFAWVTAVRRKGCEFDFSECGWCGGSRDANQPVGKAFSAEMARKRARERALSLAFPVGLASYEDAYVGGVQSLDVADSAKGFSMALPSPSHGEKLQLPVHITDASDVAGLLGDEKKMDQSVEDATPPEPPKKRGRPRKAKAPEPAPRPVQERETPSPNWFMQKEHYRAWYDRYWERAKARGMTLKAFMGICEGTDDADRLEFDLTNAVNSMAKQ